MRRAGRDESAVDPGWAASESNDVAGAGAAHTGLVSHVIAHEFNAKALRRSGTTVGFGNLYGVAPLDQKRVSLVGCYSINILSLGDWLVKS